MNKLATIALSVSVLGAGVLLTEQSVRAIGNPSVTNVRVGRPQWDVVTTSSGATPISYQTTLTGPSGNNIQLAISPALVLNGNVYFSGLGLTCSKTGAKGTGWRGPFTGYIQGASGLYCSFQDPNDAATAGWGAAWLAHPCKSGERSPVPAGQNGSAYCTST